MFGSHRELHQSPDTLNAEAQHGRVNWLWDVVQNAGQLCLRDCTASSPKPLGRGSRRVFKTGVAQYGRNHGIER